MKETWSAMRKIIAPIMFVALATTGMTVAGSTAAHATTSSPALIATFEPGDTFGATAAGGFGAWWAGAENDDAVNDHTARPGYLYQVTKRDCYAGFTLSLPSDSVISNGKVIFDIYSPVASDVVVKAEGTNNPQVQLNLVSGWQTATADLSTSAAWSSSQTYTGVSIFPGFSCGNEFDGQFSDKTYFVDNVKVNPTVATFEPGDTFGATAAGGFGAWWAGAENDDAVNDHTARPGYLYQVTKRDCYAGFTLSLPSDSVISNGKVIFDIYSPVASDVVVKAEGTNNPQVQLNLVSGWQTATADLSTSAAWSSSQTYTGVSIFPGFSCGNEFDGQFSDKTYFVDNVALVADSAAPAAGGGGTSVACSGDSGQSCPTNSAISFANGSSSVSVSGGAFTSAGDLTVTVTSPVGAADAGKHGTFQWFDTSGVTLTKQLGDWNAGKCLDASDPNQCQYMLGSNGTATFTIGVSGTGTAKFHSVGPTWASDVLTGTFTAGGSTASASPSASASPAPAVFLSFGANDDLAKLASPFEGASGAIVDGHYEFTATGQPWSGVNLINGSSNRRLTNSANSVLTFDYTNPDNSAETVMIKLEGTAAPVARTALTAQPGVNHFSVDFSTVTGWLATATYKNLAIFPGFADGDMGIAVTARDGQVYQIDNVSFNGGTSADVYTAPADLVNAAATLVSTNLNGPSGAFGNGWYHGNAPADNYVKYVNAGSTFTITYHIANAATHAALAGKTVTLSPTSPTGNTGPTAAVTGTSDSNGDVTFTITNTNTNSSSENYRVDQTTWSDPVGTQYKYEFAVTAVSGVDALSFSDNIWGHVVTTAAPAYSADVTLKSSTLVGPGAAVGNGWYHGNAPADNIVKYIVAGQSFNLVYHVEDHTTHAAIVGKTVTLSAGGNATVSGSLSAVTNSSGDATFSLTSTNSSSDAELARPTGTENAWIPVDVVGGTEYKLDFSVASLSANGNIARGDNVWTHTVKAFSSSAALNGLNVKSASTTSAVIGWTPVSGASYKLTLTGTNGTKAFTKAVTVASGSSTTVTGLPVGLLNVKVSGYAYSDSTVASASTNGAVAALSAKAAAAPAVAPVISSLVAGVRKATVTYAPIQDASNGGATVTAYQYSTDLGATWTNAPASPFEITGLGNGAAVKVRMRAVNIVGNKASTDKAATTPNVPTVAPVMASAVGGVGTVTVTYSAVASTKNGGSAITGYQYTTNNGSTWVNASASPIVISGLGNGVAVSVKMRAVNAVGNGVASAAAKTATTASAPNAAPAITSVTAGTGKVTVKYTAVAAANNGGSAITGYQYSINNGSTWLTAGAATGFDISAAKGATVSVKMRAVNTVGASVASTAKANTSAVR